MVFRATLLALFEQAPAWIAIAQHAVAAAFAVAVGTVVVLPFFIAHDEDSRARWPGFSFGLRSAARVHFSG